MKKCVPRTNPTATYIFSTLTHKHIHLDKSVLLLQQDLSEDILQGIQSLTLEAIHALSIKSLVILFSNLYYDKARQHFTAACAFMPGWLSLRPVLEKWRFSFFISSFLPQTPARAEFHVVRCVVWRRFLSLSEKCQQEYLSYGSESRAVASMQRHIAHHLYQLLQEAERGLW